MGYKVSEGFCTLYTPSAKKKPPSERVHAYWGFTKLNITHLDTIFGERA